MKNTKLDKKVDEEKQTIEIITNIEIKLLDFNSRFEKKVDLLDTDK